MCSHRIESLAHGYGALAASSQSLAGHGTERSRHGADPLSESPIRPACKKCVLAQHPEAQGPNQHEVSQLAEGHALQDSSDSKQHKLVYAIYPEGGPHVLHMSITGFLTRNSNYSIRQNCRQTKIRIRQKIIEVRSRSLDLIWCI